jgi:hypothetical protein
MASKKKLRKQVKAYRRDYEKMRGAYLDTSDDLRDLRGSVSQLLNVIDRTAETPEQITARVNLLREEFGIKPYEGTMRIFRDITRTVSDATRKPLTDALDREQARRDMFEGGGQTVTVKADERDSIIHNHDLDPTCRERRVFGGALRGECMGDAA